MKVRIHRCFLSAAAACALFVGCKKSEPANPTPGGGGTAPASPTAGATAQTPSSSKGAPAELKLKWAAGKSVMVHVDQTEDSEGTVPGLSAPMKTTTKSGRDYSLTAVKPNTEGGWELEMKLLGQQVDAKVGEASQVNFDSSKPATASEDGVSKILRRAVNATFKCQTDAVGKATKVDGVSDFAKRIFAGADGQSVTTAKSMLNEDNLKEMCSLGEALPDHPVKPGDTWTGKQEFDAGQVGKLTLELNYVFKGLEQHDGRKTAVIDVSGDISSKTATPDANGIIITIENGVIKGSVWFDAEAGMVVGYHTDQSMDLKIKMLGQMVTSKVSGGTAMKVTSLEK